MKVVPVVFWKRKKNVVNALHSYRDLPMIGDELIINNVKHKVINRINRYTHIELIGVDIDVEESE